MKKPPLRATQIVYIQKDRLIFTSDLDQKKIDKIDSEFDAKLFLPPTGHLTEGKVILTDGNHRSKALIQRGEDFIPCVLLNKAEYEWVKNSDRVADLKAFLPDQPIYYPSFFIRMKINGSIHDSTYFPAYEFPDEKTKDKILETAIANFRKNKHFAQLYDTWGITSSKIVAVDLKKLLNL